MSASDAHAHRLHLLFTAAAASVTTLTLFSLYTSWDRKRRRHELNDDVLRSLARAPRDGPTPSSGGTPGAPDGDAELAERVARPPVDGFGYDEELIREQLARNYAFFGDDGMAKIRGSSVVIVGCGGVGSWAAVMLARSGVSKIRLVDFDYVTLSSLNRHATANLSDVGTPKVKCVENALKQFSRWIDVDARVDIWRKEEGGILLEDMDWVIDAIDNITTKVDLLAYCHNNNIRVFSSMGAGAKCDPTRIQISDISHTVYDPLARSVRRRLRLQGVASGIPVVYSTEVPGDVKLLPLPEDEFEKGAVKELGVFDDFRVRILPVLGPLPATFGLHIASYIICELGGKPIPNPLPIKNRRKLYERLLRDFASRESKIAGEREHVMKIPLDEEDVSFVFEDMHVGRSILPPHTVPTRPTLVRWDPTQPISAANLVVMEHADADRHVRECAGLDLGRVRSAKHPQFVDARASPTQSPEVERGEPSLRAKSPAEVWGAEVDALVRHKSEAVEQYLKEIMS